MADREMVRASLRCAAALLVCVCPAAPQARSQVCSFCHLNVCREAERKGHERFGVSCIECHGASLPHRNAEDNKVKPDRVFSKAQVPALCAECHKKAAAGFATGKHVRALRAGSGPSCSTCHGAHGFLTAAQQEKACGGCHPSLPRACRTGPANGRLGCVECHEPHSLARRAAAPAPVTR